MKQILVAHRSNQNAKPKQSESSSGKWGYKVPQHMQTFGPYTGTLRQSEDIQLTGCSCNMTALAQKVSLLIPLFLNIK